MYQIKSVDADDYADDLERLHAATDLKPAKYETINWWLAFFEDHPIAYCGLMPSIYGPGVAYLVRVGVLAQHRGNSLQLRMMRAAERFAKRNGFAEIISDTYDNPPSANNFIRAGYETHTPAHKWSFADAIYWRKQLGAV